MTAKRVDDRFVVGALQAALPLLIWAAHFFLAYMTIKAACELDLQRFALAGFSAITLVLWLLSGVAISALIALLIFEGREARRHFEGGGMLPIVQIGATIFALAAVLWATVPMVLVPPCANISIPGAS